MGKLPNAGYGYPPIATTPDGDAAETPNGNIYHAEANLAPQPQETESSANIPTDNSSGDGDVSSIIHVRDFLRPEDIFALLVASIGHDVGHPGVNNMFLVCDRQEYGLNGIDIAILQTAIKETRPLTRTCFLNSCR